MERETRVRAHVNELEARVSQQEDSHAVRLRCAQAALQQPALKRRFRQGKLL